MDFLPPTGTPVTAITVQKPQRGDYLETLHRWGELPDIVPVLDVAQLLASLCKQNPAAVTFVLQQAILRQEIKVWGRGSASHNEEWIENQFRALNTVRKVSKALVDDQATYTLEIEPGGRPHWEAMGIKPASAVALLVCRGRKVPAELLEFLSEAARQDAGPDSLIVHSLDPTARQRNSAPKKPVERRRRDLLAPLVEQAQRECQDPTDAPAVFSVLREWAKRTPPRAPLIGVTEDGRLQWLDSNDKPQELDARALRKRVQRRTG